MKFKKILAVILSIFVLFGVLPIGAFADNIEMSEITGDLNQDGSVDLRDLILLKKALVELVEPSAYYDMNGDGVFDTLDGIRFKKIILGITAIEAVDDVQTEIVEEIWDGTKSENFAGGDGSEGSPFLIENGAQLYKMLVEYHTYDASYGKYFKINKDIYLNNVIDGTAVENLTEKKNWLAEYGSTIATASVANSFNGTLDGGHHTIYGLYIENAKSAGLFPAISSYTVIKNLNFDKLYIAGGAGYAGAIAGQVTYKTWKNGAKISNCSVINSTISRTGTGDAMVGGFVGDTQECTIDFTSCYSYNVVLSDNVGPGGIVGNAYSAGTLRITNCYTIGYYPVRANVSKAVCSNVYTDTARPEGNTTENITVLSTEQMKGENAKLNMVGFDFSSSWQTVENGYPKHYVYVRPDYVWDGTKSESFAGGDGSETSPFLIENGAQLYKMLVEYHTYEASYGKYFKIVNDIYLNDVADGTAVENLTDKNNWLAEYGSTIATASKANSFNGTLDGGNHTIYGLYIESANSSGLFPAISSYTVIKNLKFDNLYIVCRSGSAGAIAGQATYSNWQINAKISSCSVVNSTISNEGNNSAIVGGLLGDAQNCNVDFSNCYSYDVVLNDNVGPGGIVGNAYSAGTLRITNCYTIGYYPVRANVSKAVCSNVYTDTARPEGNTTENITVLSTEQMKGENAKLNMVGFDFIRLWEIVENGYPKQGTYLRPSYVWDGTKAENFAGGDGSESSPYLIENGAQLYKMVAEYSDAETGTDPKNIKAYFELTKDIYLNDILDADLTNPTVVDWQASNLNAWYTLSGISKGFCGEFDGGGHTIYGLFANGSFAGLIPVLTDGGSIKNVILKDSFVNSFSTNGSAGGLVGYAGEHYKLQDVSITGCMVDNCLINSASKSAGGIIGGFGELKISVSNCSVIRTKVGSTNYDNPNLASAFIGKGWGSIIKSVTNCFTDGYSHPVTSSTNQEDLDILTAKIKYTNVYTSATRNFDVEGITYLTDEQMQGPDALTNMNLSTDVWMATDSYPVVYNFTDLDEEPNDENITKISVGNVNGTYGTEITVPITIEHNVGIMASLIKVQYDSTALKYKDYTYGNIFDDYLVNCKDNTIIILSLENKNKDADGIMLNLHFEVITKHTGEYSVEIINADLGNYEEQRISVQTVAGYVATYHEHTYGEWETVVYPTCTSEGTKQRNCTICDFIETDKIPVLDENHSFENGVCLNCKVISEDALQYVIWDSEAHVIKCETSIGGNVRIPSQLSGFFVTGILDSAFENCTLITDITIPDTVTSIGAYAFNNTGYYNNNDNWENDVLYIDEYLIDAKIHLEGSYNIKEGTKVIANGAFQCSDHLTELIIPKSVIGIGEYSFCSSSITAIIVDEENENFSSNQGILFSEDGTVLVCYPAGKTASYYSIPEGVTRIDNYAFNECVFLASITIPNSVKGIYDFAFSNCESLVSIKIPNGVEYIGYSAFSSCENLTSITIPESVIEIDYAAFIFCDSLKAVYYCGTEENWNNISIDEENSDLIYTARYYHNFSEWETVVYPTCTSEGTKQRVCFDCDEIETETIFATGHKIINGFTVENSAQYPFELNDGVYTSINHSDYSSSTFIITATKDSELKIEYKVSSESYCDKLIINLNDESVVEVSGTDVEWETVWLHLNEGDTVYITYMKDASLSYGEDKAYFKADLSEEIDASEVEPYCEASVICDLCGEIVKEPIGCDYVGIVTDPTCTQNGYTTYTCTRCDNSYITDETEKKGHNWEIRYYCEHNSGLLPDIDFDDEFELTDSDGCETYEERYCTNCYEVDYCNNISSNFSDWIIRIEPTYDYEGEEYRYCYYCYYEEIRSIPRLDPPPHYCYYEEYVIEPTCTTDGYTLHQCSCGNSYTTNIITALGHNFRNWDIVLAATCEENGYKQSKCENCDIYDYVEINSTGHKKLKEFICENSDCYPFEEIDGAYESTNHKDDSLSTFTIRAIDNCVLNLQYRVSSEENYDMLIIKHNDNLLDKISGSVLDWKYLDINLNDGDTVTITYSKDLSISNGEDKAYFKANLYVSTNEFEPTCEESVDCDICGKIIKEALGHNYLADIIEPRCTEKGYTIYTCSNCYDSYADDETEALGHNYSEEFTIDIPNGDFAEGSKSRHCLRCDEKTDITTIPRNASGYCGENAEWKIDPDGTLIIFGIGATANYGYYSYVPWYSYSNIVSKIVISDSITAIGHYAFDCLGNLETVEFGNPDMSISKYYVFPESDIRFYGLGGGLVEQYVNDNGYIIIKPKNPIIPSVPALLSKNATSIILLGVEGYEYSMDGVNWQSSNVFDGLLPNTEYTFYQRIVEDAYQTSVSSGVLKVITTEIPQKPQIEDIENNMVKIVAIEGYEYSLDLISWQSSNIFEGLEYNKKYKVYTRTVPSDIVPNPAYSEPQEFIIVSAPEIMLVGATKIMLKKYDNYEYSIDGITWQSSNIFNRLIPDFEYAVYQRYSDDSVYSNLSSCAIFITDGQDTVDIKPDSTNLALLKKLLLKNSNDMSQDYNDDGKVDLKDLVRLKKFLAGMDVPLGTQNDATQTVLLLSQPAYLEQKIQ